MKKLLIFMILISLSVLSAQVIGKIGLVTGLVKYKESPNAIYKDATRNMLIHKDGVLKLDLSSSVVLSFNDLGETEVTGRKELSILEIYDQLKKPKSLVDRIKGGLKNIQTFSSERPKSEAGIRRDEQHLDKQELFYWEEPEWIELSAAIALYDQEKYPEAIESFVKVIEQDPLSREAELAHGYLIVIYSANPDTAAKMQEHLELLKRDFPNSEFLD
ncbi:MAG: hypothetical protein WCY84_03775 [Candidatus Cloacimonadaceae bacterium]